MSNFSASIFPGIFCKKYLAPLFKINWNELYILALYVFPFYIYWSFYFEDNLFMLDNFNLSSISFIFFLVALTFPFPLELFGGPESVIQYSLSLQVWFSLSSNWRSIPSISSQSHDKHWLGHKPVASLNTSMFFLIDSI